MILFGKEVIYLSRYNLIRMINSKIFFADPVKSLRSIRDPASLLQLEVFREYRLVWWTAVGIFMLALLVANLFNSQFLLPVTSWKDRWEAFLNFCGFMIGYRGPLIFVKDGKIISHMGEKERVGPGVALVYSNNAVVIGSKVHGPGVVFTWQPKKKVAAVMDLRKQIRTSDTLTFLTRDGIEIDTSISVQFSISAPPEIIYLTLSGKGDDKDDLRVLELDERGDMVIDIVQGGLPDEELNEVINVVRKLRAGNLDEITLLELDDYHSPGLFNQERVQECYKNQPRRPDTGEMVMWYELPIQVAIEEFSNMIALYPFDDLFLPPPDYLDMEQPLEDDEAVDAQTRISSIDLLEEKKRIPIENLRRDFIKEVKLSGFLGYRLVVPVGGGEVKVGDRISNLHELTENPIRLEFPRPLRKREISVTSVSFGPLEPHNQEVKAQIVENLKARWNSEATKTEIGFQEEAALIRSRAKVRVQQDTVYALRDVLTTSDKAKTAFILRIFQALEAATVGSNNKEISNMVKMLGDIRAWFKLSSDEKKQQGDSI